MYLAVISTSVIRTTAPDSERALAARHGPGRVGRFALELARPRHMFVLLGPGLLALAVLTRRSLVGIAQQRIAWWPLGFLSFGAELALSSTALGQQPSMLQWGS